MKFPHHGSILGVLFSLAAALGLSAQIEPTLFGDGHGPAIADDFPDTGSGDWLVVDEAPGSEAEAAPVPSEVFPAPPSSDPAVDGLPTVPEAGGTGMIEGSPDVAAPEEAGEVQAPPPAAPKKRSSWLPWLNKNADDPPTDDADSTAGPRLGKLRSGSSEGSASVDSGLLPSELRRWRRDPRQAMAQAREERKLLLLWMTDSLRSSTSRSQAIEVFRHTRFLRMAKEHMILTKLDFAEHDIAGHRYTRYLKEKLGVLGYPSLILFSPDGEEVWRERGYRRGHFPAVIDALQYQIDTHELKERDRREKLLDRGYRVWENDRNQSLFARAVEVSREEKTVLLVDEHGERYHYPVIQLSEDDRSWLAEQFLR